MTQFSLVAALLEIINNYQAKIRRGIPCEVQGHEIAIDIPEFPGINHRTKEFDEKILRVINEPEGIKRFCALTEVFAKAVVAAADAGVTIKSNDITPETFERACLQGTLKSLENLYKGMVTTGCVRGQTLADHEALRNQVAGAQVEMFKAYAAYQSSKARGQQGVPVLAAIMR